MSFVDDLMYMLNREVANLSVNSIESIAGLLKEAEQELTQKLAAYLAKHPGDTRFTAHQMQGVLIQIRGAMNMISKLAGPMAAALQAQSGLAFDLAQKHLKYEIEKLSSHFTGAVRPIPISQAEALLDVNRVLYPRHVSSSIRYAGEVGDHVRRQLALGVLQGETLDQMTKRISALGGRLVKDLSIVSPGAKAQAMVTGLFIRPKSSAERLVRTEVVHSYNAAIEGQIHELNQVDPGYHLKWDAAVDRRTCEICAKLHNLVVPDGKPFPGGMRHPPAHPNCRCAAVAWRKEWKEASFKERLTDKVTPGKPVPVSKRTSRRIKY
jgi:SPP1 gp7 family putative phage head morphogenesis protein